METWTIEQLNTWLKHFDNKNSSINEFLGGADQATITKAKKILAKKMIEQKILKSGISKKWANDHLIIIT
tara:strand:+ start:265 stop:474 length:210 start_codon:yes stop_codon:yes gene_type:complete